MEKLFKILAQGEMPDFFEILQALNDVSDIDWNGAEASQDKILAVLKGNRIPNYPQIACSQFCESCG